MEQYSAISKLFLETIEETLSEEFNRNRIPQPQSNKGKINLRPKGLNTSDLEEVYKFVVNDYKGKDRADLQEFIDVITVKLNEEQGLFSSEDLEEA